MIAHISGTMHTNIFTPLGGIGVALFLFLSGYGINESYKRNGLKLFWVKRLSRILIPYIIVISVRYLLNAVPEDYSWKSYLLDISGLHTSYWFVTYLLFWYVVFWIFTKFLYKYSILALLIIAVASFFLTSSLESEQSLSFLFGVAASQNSSELAILSKKKKITLGIILLVISIAALAIKQLPPIRALINTFPYFGIELMIKLPAALAVIILGTFFNVMMNSRFLQLSGILSYELYLIHMPFIPLVSGSIIRGVILILGVLCFSYGFHEFTSYITSFIITKFSRSKSAEVR